MHRYNLGPRGTITSHPDSITEGSVDPAVALALVVANVPLPKETQKALRLTCRATRLAVDQTITDLVLVPEAAEQLHRVDSPLLLGLTSLTFTTKLYHSWEPPAVLNACSIASRNCGSLEALKFQPTFPADGYGNLLQHFWPRLRSLVLYCDKGVFETSIHIDTMPSLTELRLEGELRAADVAALHRGAHFSSTIEILKLLVLTGDSGDHEFSNDWFKSCKPQPGCESWSLNFRTAPTSTFWRRLRSLAWRN